MNGGLSQVEGSRSLLKTVDAQVRQVHRLAEGVAERGISGSEW